MYRRTHLLLKTQKNVFITIYYLSFLKLNPEFLGSMSITQLYIGSTHINDKKNN